MTRDEVIRQLRHTERDLRAFRQAYDAIQRRVNELDSDPEQREFFLTWAATQASMNVLIMAITRCEGLIEDYKSNVEPAQVLQIARETNE